MYYDKIDKASIDYAFNTVIEDYKNNISECLTKEIEQINQFITEVTKTVSHGFEYNIIKDNITDEGLANKLKAIESKKIKNHSEPYNAIFNKYSVHVYSS